MRGNVPFTKEQVEELPLGFTPSGNDINRKQRRQMMKIYAKLLKNRR